MNPAANARTIAQRLGGRRRLVRIDHLRTDPAYQRPPDREKVRLLARALKTPPILVNLRTDGELYIVDGQHRAAAQKLRGRHVVSARVIHVPSSEEGRLYADLNSNQPHDEADETLLVKRFAEIDRLMRTNRGLAA